MPALRDLPALDGTAVAVRLAAFLAAREGDPATRGFALAVVGPGGELIGFGAHTACPPLPRLLAVRKAVTALSFRRPSAKVAAEVKEGTLDLAPFHDERLLAMAGGVPVFCAERVIGGVGVSGLPPAQDIAMAEQFARELLASP
jgi:glc operon protein GlcG